MSSISSHIRLIRPDDNPIVSQIIREIMTEFACVGQGFSIEDPEVDHMFQAYDDPRAAYYVIELDGKISGCGGFAQLEGGTSDTCELKKMYFLTETRGLGLGKRLLELCIEKARDCGYQKMYLETVERMTAANGLYQHMGFQLLPGPLGATGHGGCDSFYELHL